MAATSTLALIEEKTATESTKGVDQPTTSLEEAIRARAYELYEQRGKQDGHDLEDWLEAENEIAA